MIALIDNGHGKDTPGKRSPLLTSDMLSDAGEHSIVQTHIEGILDYIKTVKK